MSIQAGGNAVKKRDAFSYDRMAIKVGDTWIEAPSSFHLDALPEKGRGAIDLPEPLEIRMEQMLTPEASAQLAAMLPMLAPPVPSVLHPLYVSLSFPDARRVRRRLARAGFRGRRGALRVDLQRLPVTHIGEAADGTFDVEIGLR